MDRIRNFSIIAHIDHGKSTLADRMLEITNTVDPRKMKDRVLDDMELEQERGITIKMRPVRMEFDAGESAAGAGAPGEKYVLNLIDTPGHIDFYYEVSRALKAVEGSILLVDSTQGVQAQTLTTLGMAKASNLVIIPVLTKIDSPLARIEEVKDEMVKLLDCDRGDIISVSGRTGEGVEELLREVVRRVPPPKSEFAGATAASVAANVPADANFRALVFDFQYSTHRGVIVFVRVLDGRVAKNTTLLFRAADEKFTALEVGIFAPEEKAKDYLEAGEIGYIVTGIKKPGIASVGDTIVHARGNLPALPGYMTPKPVVWASIYPESQDDFAQLAMALDRLRLSDSSYSFEEEASGTLGRGFRCGFLGMLHLEIIAERLRREFRLDLVVTSPSISYIVTTKKGVRQTYYSPSLFPDYSDIAVIEEPWVDMVIITPNTYVSLLMPFLFDHEGEVGDTTTFGDDRTSINVHMPLRELMRGFFDRIKSITSGYASLSYEIVEFRIADVVKLELLVADEVVEAFSRVVSMRRVEEEAEKSVERLHNVLPRQQFETKIQGKALGRIMSSKTLSALRKDVTGTLSGGDITRKMKLLEKQKKGKKKMKGHGSVTIPQDVFIKMMRPEEK